MSGEKVNQLMRGCNDEGQNSLNFAGTYFCGWGVKELLRGFIFADPGGFPILITWENAWNHHFARIKLLFPREI